MHCSKSVSRTHSPNEVRKTAREQTAILVPGHLPQPLAGGKLPCIALTLASAEKPNGTLVYRRTQGGWENTWILCPNGQRRQTGLSLFCLASNHRKVLQRVSMDVV